MVVTTVDTHLDEWRLAPASTEIPGGYRTLHELAVAIAATGREVELPFVSPWWAQEASQLQAAVEDLVGQLKRNQDAVADLSRQLQNLRRGAV